jgi:pentatricopeptide repeat protein
MYEKALDLFEQMSLHPDEVTFTIVFNACADLSNDRAKQVGKKLLKQMPKNYRNSVRVINSAIDMLMKFGDVQSAEDLFRSIMNKDIVTYGAIMKGKLFKCIFNNKNINLGYVENKMYEKALDLFEQMSLDPNEVTLTIVFNACAHLSNNRAKQIGNTLLQQMSKNYRNCNHVMNSVIDMLMKFGDVQSAEDLFRSITNNNLVTYGAMISGYNRNNEPHKALKLFEEMKQQDIIPNENVCAFIISTCAQLGIRTRCENILDQIPLHLQNNQRIQTAKINMWASIH